MGKDDGQQRRCREGNEDVTSDYNPQITCYIARRYILKQNITLRIDKDLLRKGKIIAAQNQTSVSKMLSEHLKQIVDREEQYEASKRSALHALKNGFHLGGKITWRREELYER